MKRVSFLLATLFVCKNLLASPVGNPAFPRLLKEGYIGSSNSYVSFRAGYEGDFVSDAQMSIQGSHVDHFQQSTNSGIITTNLVDRVDLYGVLGSSRICSDWRFVDKEQKTHRIELETDYHFAWSAGARILLIEWSETFLGIGGRYSQAKFSPNWLTIDGNPSDVTQSQMNTQEWQIDLDVAHAIDIFVPYLGIKYSNHTAKFAQLPSQATRSATGQLEMKNHTPVGVVIGCTLTTGKYFMFNIEGRLVDEEAVTVVGDFRF